MAFKMKPSSFKQPEWSTNEAGYDVKTTTRKNLLGRERVVKKYYDPETGEKLGKHVIVDRAEGDPRAKKQKIKKVNPGLTQSGGVGKIRLSENPWENPSGKSSGETDLNRAQRAAEIKDKNTTYDAEGNPRIPKYAEVFKDFKKEGDKYINPRSGGKYDDLSDFITDVETWWGKQADDTSNEKLRKQGQEYGLDEHGNVKFSKSPNKKVRGYKMKRKSN